MRKNLVYRETSAFRHGETETKFSVGKKDYDGIFIGFSDPQGLHEIA